ncbi:hypothetical protein Tco_0758539, partial [Tanacetum coccineum]
MAVATVPFVTSFVTLTPKREDGGHIDFVSEPNLSFVPPPPVLTAAVTTTVIAEASSTSVLGAGAELATQVYHRLLWIPPSIGAAGPDIAGPSHPLGTGLLADTFYVSQEMDSETLRQIYVPKWNMVNESVLDDPDVCRSLVDQLALPELFSQHYGMDYEQLFVEFNVGAARQTCLSAEVRMRFEHNLKERKRLEEKFAKQVDLMKKKDAEIANL